MPYTLNYVTCDGINNYWARGADLTGSADSNKFTFSFWYDPSAGDGTDRYIYRIAQGKIYIRHLTTNKLRIVCQTSTSTTLWSVDTLTSLVAGGGPYHVMGSVKVDGTNVEHLYVNGVDDINSATLATGSMDFTRSNHGVLGQTNGADLITGNIADFYFNVAEYIDLSVLASGEKFIASGAAVDLGNDGSTPTGTAPIIFLGGAMTADERLGNTSEGWNDGFNAGTGGNGVMNGTVVDVAPPFSPPIIANQACDFGAKTEINAGAFQLVNTGDGVDTVGTITGTASTQYTAAVVLNEIVLTAKVASPTAGTVIIADVTGLDATNIGSVTVTVSTIADAYSAASITEMKNAYDGSVLADQILTRDFWANPDSAREDFWAATALPSGTFNGSNHVQVTPHVGAATKIGGIWLNASAGAGCRYLEFNGVTFTGDGTEQVMMCFVYQGASEILFDTCHFEDSRGYIDTGDWVAAVNTNSNSSHTIEFKNCTLKYVGGKANTLVTRGSDCKLIGNIIDVGIDTDFIQMLGTSMDNFVITDNKIYVKFGFNALDHGDFFQFNGTSLTKDMENLTFERNTMNRGQDVNELLDGQGLFMSNFGAFKLDGAVVKNNQYVGTMGRAISLQGDNLDIQYNTTVYDKFADPATAPTKNSGIHIGPGNNVTVSNNVANIIDIDVAVTNLTETNNQIADELTVGQTDSYDQLFNAPVGGADLDSTNSISSYKAKVGGLLDVNQIGARDTDGNYITGSAPALIVEGFFTSVFSTPVKDVFKNL